MHGLDTWIRPERHPALVGGEVHVWRVSLEVGSADFISTARRSPDFERVGPEGFRFARKRARVERTHNVLKLLLARYLRLDLGEIALTSGPHGKPMLPTGTRRPPLFFNVAHSSDIGLIAFAQDFPVGIDLEAVVPGFDWETIARRFFSPREYAFLMSTPADEQLPAFMVSWTRREACLKAVGLGLAGGLEELELSTEPRRHPRLVHAPREMLPLSRWKLVDLVPADGYQGCLVTESSDVKVRRWAWHDSGEVPQWDHEAELEWPNRV